MSAIRTQIYLTDQQRQRIDAAATATGMTMAEVIRRAVDQYLPDDVDPALMLSATFGAAPNATVPSRDDWDRG